MKRSRAAVFAGSAGEVELREFDLPANNDPGILVRVLGCTLCGSDLHSFHGRRSVPIPTVLGHEIVGQIVDLNSAVNPRDVAGNKLRLGDRVTWAIVANCGDCFYCQHGLPQKCLQGVKYGHEAILPGRELTGGLADYCLLAPGTSVVVLPAEISLSVAGPASCATATVAAALSAAGEIRDQTVCVLGGGMLGLTACAMARSRGAAAVVCVDPLASRRELADRFGATSVADPAELAAVARQAAGSHGFDVVLELSGQPTAFLAAWPLLRIGGTMVLVGSVYPSPPVELRLEEVVRRLISIRGVHNYAPVHLVDAVDFLAAHHAEYPFEELVCAWFGLEEVAEAFRRASEPGVIRVGVRP